VKDRPFAEAAGASLPLGAIGDIAGEAKHHAGRYSRLRASMPAAGIQAAGCQLILIPS